MLESRLNPLLRVALCQPSPFRLESIDAGKKITPIRPVACLAGSLSVEDMNIRLM